MAQGMTNSFRIVWIHIWTMEKNFVVDGKASKIPDAMMLVDIW